MTGLAWAALYQSFAAFAFEARKYRFYVREVGEMEDSLFEMCPFPKSYKIEKNKEEDAK